MTSREVPPLPWAMVCVDRTSRRAVSGGSPVPPEKAAGGN